MRELSQPFKPRRKVLALLILSFHIGIAASWAVAYSVMDLVFRYWLPQYGHTPLRQYLVVVLTFSLLFYAMKLIRLFFAPVRRQMDWFLEMINAMKQLSRGNFNVNLQTNPRFMGQFSPLVDSFNEMASELSRMEEMRQEFISNVSHEIQSPLTSIGGFARALQQDDLAPETRKRYVQIIETESKRLSRMSDNLLKLTSLESNHHPFDKKAYRLDRQLRHLILSCEPLWQAKELEMDVDLSEVTIAADEDLMSQVWLNLLHNSIKFTPAGGTIGIALAGEAGRVRLVVTDSGPGLSQQALPHVFERFFKADPARDRSSGGSGLGLSIVKKIVEMHGGEVFADNASHGGARFTVLLPLS